MARVPQEEAVGVGGAAVRIFKADPPLEGTSLALRHQRLGHTPHGRVDDLVGRGLRRDNRERALRTLPCNLLIFLQCPSRVPLGNEASAAAAAPHLLVPHTFPSGPAGRSPDAATIFFLFGILLLLGTLQPSWVCRTDFSPELGLPGGN